MRTIYIGNLRGGVGKTLSTVNLAHEFSELGYKVLIIDNDKQGNASAMFKRHDYEHDGTDKVMTDRHVDMSLIIQHTENENIDIVAANMKLLSANRSVLLDFERPQQTRFKDALEQVKDKYDYCLIDNAPDINISTINALVCADDVIIPVTIDEFSVEGLEELKEQIDQVKEAQNPNLHFLGCFITQYDKTNECEEYGEQEIIRKGFELFETKIHKTPKMKPSTFAKMPISVYSKRCKASKDYKDFVQEYLKKVADIEENANWWEVEK